MDIELRLLRHARALAEHRNYARAARALRLSQPALSRSIRTLEAHVGARLFDRGRSGAEPTDAGRVFLEHAAGVLARAEDMSREMRLLRGLDLGELAVGAGTYPSEMLVATAVARLVRAHPAVRVRVVTDNWAALIGLVRRETPSRLVTFATNHPADELHFAKVDVISLNAYPGWYAQDREQVRPVGEVVPFFDAFIRSLDERGLGGKPFIISEFGAGAIRGWRDRFKAHWSEEFQAEMLGTICRYVMERPRVAGIALWHFADAQTYTSAHAVMRPRTINDKGTLDEYRRPKLAYDQVRRAFRGM